jgi:TPR repeat protein
MYDAGIGVPQDNVEAHKWYSLAIAKLAGPTDATARDVATANRKGLAARMTESELADAQQAATEWKPK